MFVSCVFRHCQCVTPFCRDEKKMHSFVKKRVHLSEKTTCRFYENDGLFLVKRRVVFLVLFERRGF